MSYAHHRPLLAAAPLPSVDADMTNPQVLKGVANPHENSCRRVSVHVELNDRILGKFRQKWIDTFRFPMELDRWEPDLDTTVLSDLDARTSFWLRKRYVGHASARQDLTDRLYLSCWSLAVYTEFDPAFRRQTHEEGFRNRLSIRKDDSRPLDPLDTNTHLYFETVTRWLCGHIERGDQEADTQNGKAHSHH